VEVVETEFDRSIIYQSGSLMVVLPRKWTRERHVTEKHKVSMMFKGDVLVIVVQRTKSRKKNKKRIAEIFRKLCEA